MTSRFLILFVGLLSCLPMITKAQSREGQIEISGSYGRGSYNGEFLWLGYFSSTSPESISLRSSSGNIFGTARYYILNRFSAGLSVGNETINFDRYIYSQKQNSIQTQYLTIAAEFQFIYYNVENFQAYTYLGLGNTTTSGKYGGDLNRVAIQYTLTGISRRQPGNIP